MTRGVAGITGKAVEMIGEVVGITGKAVGMTSKYAQKARGRPAMTTKAGAHAEMITGVIFFKDGAA